MKLDLYKFFGVLFLFLLQGGGLLAQDDEITLPENKPVKETFESIWIIDNQTVMVPFKGTIEFDIQHRFGLVYNGYADFWGLYAPSNIRLGFGYVPVENLMVGFGITKTNLIWDFNAKYAILKQMRSGGMPFSLTYYVNAGMDTRDKDAFTNPDELVRADRVSYFHQLMLARKFSDKLSVQLAGSLSHFNTVDAEKNDDGEAIATWNNDHYAVAISSRYKVSNSMSVMVNYDQPLTHDSKDPQPNFSFGLELTTSAHQFQIFFGNFNYLSPQYNNSFNSNWGFGSKSVAEWDPEWLIGFNITRLWN